MATLEQMQARVRELTRSRLPADWQQWGGERCARFKDVVDRALKAGTAKKADEYGRQVAAFYGADWEGPA